jgi:cell fate (sporulation/competence/biofilm development) regulator YlbF (YheA/YmcA/DUF963 family)
MVNLSDDTKARFDRLQPDDMTQGEFVALLLDHYELTDDDGQPDVAKVLDRMDELEKTVGSKTELAAYRGAQQAIDERLTE